MSIKQLSAFNREKVKEHFLRLDEDSRRSRFCSTMNDASIEAYVNKLDFHNNGIFGIFNNNLDIIGLGECIFYNEKKGTNISGEVAFSVEKSYQGKKLGNQLMRRVVQYANMNNLKELKMYFLKNNSATFHLAKKYNFKMEHYSSEISGTVKVHNIPPILDTLQLQVEEIFANLDLAQKMNQKIINNNVNLFNDTLSKMFKM